MELKKKQSNFYPVFKKKLKFFLRYLFNKKTKVVLITLFIFFIFFIGNLSGLLVSGFFGTFDEPSRKAIDILHKLNIGSLPRYKIFLEGILAENIKIPLNYAKGQFSKPEKIFIDIDFENYKRIEYKREQALERGILISSGEDYVPAKIKYQDKELDVRLRLKGDMLEHLNGDKWSFRIKVKGDDALFGMKTFSIQNPKVRNYLDEFVYHKTLKNEGVMSIRYNFIEVFINGKNKGIYAIEEHFEKQLIENNHKREGVIIKFNEDFIAEEYLLTQNHLYFTEDELVQRRLNEDLNFYISNIETFDNEEILEDPLLAKQFEEARNLLECFRKGTLKTHEVFDVDMLAKYFAINTLMRVTHGSNWNNIRFYYNPLTSLLEPIGYDAESNKQKLDSVIDRHIPDYFGEKNYSQRDKIFWWDLIFEDKIFFEKYMQELERVSQKSYLDELFLKLDEEIKKNTNILHKDNPIYHFPKETYYETQEKLRYKLNPVQCMNIYFQKYLPFQHKIILYIGGTDFLPIEIINVVYNDSVIFELNQQNKILQPRTSHNPANYQEFEFNVPSNFVWNDSLVNNLKVNYKIFGLQKEMNQSVFPWSYLEEDFLEKDFIRQEPNTGAFDILEINEETKLIFIKEGIWNLNESIRIPPGYTVFCKSGTIINLIEEAMIISYSPISFSGTMTAPIKIISSDKTGQGLTVLNADKESYLKYVYFEDLRNPSKYNWELTGAITFYKSPVRLDNVKFLNLNSEDSLNIISSKYEIKNSIFENCYSDCFDGDFSDGVLESTLFNNCGNDGIDVSGSVVYAENIEIINAGDKGISVGEKSNFTGEGITINKGYLGVASKDSSGVKISSIIISNCDYDFAIYQKKSEFGSSSINAVGVNVLSSKNGNIIEKGSDFFLNDKIILGTQDRVYEKLYLMEK